MEFNILTVVTAQSSKRIKRIYQYFGEQGFTYQQYIPCIDPFEENKGSLSYSLTPDRYGKFLKDLFDYWYQDWKDGHPVYNRTFENWVGMLLNYPPESCNMMGICSEQWVIEADGSVYPCDFYVLDDWKLGNIRSNSFEEMNQAREDLDFVSLSAMFQINARNAAGIPYAGTAAAGTGPSSPTEGLGTEQLLRKLSGLLFLCLSQTAGNGPEYPLIPYRGVRYR